MKLVVWIVAAAASGYASHLALAHDTPVDRALPLIAVAVTFLASVSYPSIMLAVPVLITAEIAIVDEAVRLLAFGAVLAVSVCAALAGRAVVEAPRAPAVAMRLRNDAPWREVIVALVAIVLLRWIPPPGALLLRELFLVITAASIVIVLGRTPFAAAVAVVTIVATPAVPLATLALPVVVLCVALLARTFGMPRLSLTWPSCVILAFVMLFFAWSGVVARGTSWLVREAERNRERQTIGHALSPGDATVLAVPAGAASLIVSGANVAHLSRGALLGRLDPGGIPLRVGDAADWGYMRREQFYGSRNPLPRLPAGKIRDYGYDAWIDGAGRIPLPENVRTIRVTADPSLPPHAALQVEAFEMAAR